MTIKTTYQNVKENYPEALQELESKLRKGKSKYKNSPIDEFEYSFSVAEQVKSMSGLDLVNMLNNGVEEEEKEETIEEIVNRRVSNSFASINMKTPTSVYNESIDEIPPEVKDSYIESEEESRKEQERLDNMTPEERREHEQELIDQLSSMGGFFGIIGQ